MNLQDVVIGESYLVTAENGSGGLYQNGDVVTILEYSSPYFLIKSLNGYDAYVDAGELSPIVNDDVVITIKRSDLPEVTDVEYALEVDGIMFSRSRSAVTCRKEALRLFAMAEYIDKGVAAVVAEKARRAELNTKDVPALVDMVMELESQSLTP